MQGDTPMLEGIRAVSFDLDDTFWDCPPAIRHAESTLFDWFRTEAPRVLDTHDAESIHAHRIQFAGTRPDLMGDVTAMRLAAIRQLLVEHDYAESLAQPAFDAFYRARSEVELYDGVESLLDALGKRYRLAAITNGNADLHIIGLAKHFDIIQQATLDTPAKPAPDMFHACLNHFDLPASAMMHVGDSAHTDVGGAHGAGVVATWFNSAGLAWPDSAPRPQYEVRSIQELATLLLDQPLC